MISIKKIEPKVEELQTLLDEIKFELETLESDYAEESLDDDERAKVPNDLRSIEKHLRNTAMLFTHLSGRSIPDWAMKP